MGSRLSRIRSWLDSTPLASIGLALMREATGRSEPLEAIRPTRPRRFRGDARIGFWSLAAGVGSSTTAALVAQRAASGGQAPVLVDLDRWAPSLALRAGIESATVVDALVQPDRERDLVSRWANVPFLAGSPLLYRDFDPDRVGALLARLAGGRGMVVDLGAGADALDERVIAQLTRLCVVSGGRAAQLQALFCARRLLRSATCPVGLVVVGVDDRDATLIAARAQLPLLGVIPDDPYLARDEFAARAPTMRAIDRLIGGL
jgi:MinD-like ATPase involved in chromosome partitioning or flagellar assembly